MLARRYAPIATFALLPAPLAQAQPPAPDAPSDKSSYTLFHPTPSALMREMSTDRPDTTESPFTLDAGHVQVELSFLDYAYDRGNGTASRTLAAAPVLVKFGLTNTIDLQIGIDPHTQVRAEDRATGTTNRASGFGDTTVRLKVNAFGNDSTEATDGWALAVMPYVTFPTARDGLGADNVEGGIIVPAAVTLCEGWSVGVMAELDFLSRPSGASYALDFLQTATLACDLSDCAGAYIEYAGYLSLSDEDDYRAYFDAGLTYALNADVQLDCGVRIGLSDAADDLGFFAGVSLRW